MTAPVNNASVYGDFAGLEKLKSGAARNDPAAIRQVAKQFESLFARMMIKSMRDAIGKDPIFGSDQAQTYQGMFDDQLSLELTQGKGLGLADMLMRQLQHAGVAGAGTSSPAGKTGTSAPAGTSGTSGTTGISGTSGTRGAPGPTTPATTAERTNFISEVWPDAERAAQQLGVHPVSLVAQAALETNWGRSVPKAAGGATSNNLFGIKAGSRWSGAAVTAATQEYQGGAATSTSAAFRAYASPGESFQDYVALLRGNARFSGALGSGTSVSSFAQALQQGGYATDPDYAQKVTAVAGQVVATLARAAGAPLKFAADVPMTSQSRAAPGEELSHG
ncbi:MAG TPA: flagellar assembly peptidoglycan hydrolase FlgJ [Steroidobacteraceae bacterium]|nr:flagellar assembly peptidoglycan hydrolase FlgJ [Steroidobacteraceae bacterium]